MAPGGSRRSRLVAAAQTRNELAAPTNSLSNTSSNVIPDILSSHILIFLICIMSFKIIDIIILFFM